MISEIIKIISNEYLVENEFEGNNLILREEGNDNNVGLKVVKINIRKISEFVVYKFDQPVIIKAQKHETYAHFLHPGKYRAMCDFIIFFCNEDFPGQLFSWVINLKSKNDGNNIDQMRAGGRLCDFLLGKFQDILLNPDNKTVYLKNNIAFILFSQQKTNGIKLKTFTNPLLNKKSKLRILAQNCPEDFLRVTNSAIELMPAEIEE